MALKSTIFKAELQLADLDRSHFGDYSLTLARHPSETDERMMVRLLAFVLHAHEALQFGRGLSTDDEPALWRKDLTGLIELWIEVGLPDDKALRQACGRAKQVCVYTYGGRQADQWWKENLAALGRLKNLTVMNLSQEGSRALAGLAQRNMDLHCTVQDGQLLIGDGTNAVQIELTTLQESSIAMKRES